MIHTSHMNSISTFVIIAVVLQCTLARPLHGGTSSSGIPPQGNARRLSGISSSDSNGIHYLTADETCPDISLEETSLMIREDLLPIYVRYSMFSYSFNIRTQCRASGSDGGPGSVFDPVYTPLQFQGQDRVTTVMFGGYRYLRVYPKQVVGSMRCGEQITCDVDLVAPFSGFGIEPYSLLKLAKGDCDYDYRNFIQWGYKQRGLGFTCNEGMVFYTLMCVECQEDYFPWELAYNLSGPVLEDTRESTMSSFNYVMVITAVSVVGFAVLMSLVAVLVRSRRRRAAIDSRVAEMVNVSRNTNNEKPPEVFVLSEDCVDGFVPPPDYSGPIVVLNTNSLNPNADSIGSDCSDHHSGSGGELDVSLSLPRGWSDVPQIAIVDPDHGVSGDSNGDKSSNDDDPSSATTSRADASSEAGGPPDNSHPQ
jgi:hypothetical protein